MPPLPWKDRADLIERPDTVIFEAMRCAIWPTRTRTAPGGTVYDSIGEAPLEYLFALRVANRVLRRNGRDYLIVSATAHEFLPHVALRLRETVGAGN